MTSTMAPAAPLEAVPADAPPLEATDTFPWSLAAGLAALAIAGGAAVAFMRRRRDGSIDTADVPPTAYSSQPLAGVSQSVSGVHPSPSLNSGSVSASPSQSALRSTPSFAAAPHGSMGRHEAMAMAGPTAENPFLTLKKRLKRARFHDRMERLEYDALLAGQVDRRREPASAWEIAQRPAPAAGTAMQDVRRPGPARTAPGFKPGFSRS
ncbi:MAG: hypothetical protein U0S50_12340 [Sphingopyxis sp.]|uniref:hypothetical protein n=1 Tax=Sphingopyxis sp. TaxID=1908224 RepID=UPI002ABCB392|nr:hypothetical protein [Sphingopyxis sp.]MDZ3832585.1 hypothetical protein [Sphingopyxis sp.]